MQQRDFIDPTTGSLIAVDLPGIPYAFDPAPLPPDWKFPVELWPLLRDARVALATLDGSGLHLTDPYLLLRPLQNREAIASSSIEGTYATPEELLLFEPEPTEATPKEGDGRREVHNYREALAEGWRLKDRLSFSLRLIRDLHRRLLQGVRGGAKNPGEFRTGPVQIGRPARFVPPPADRVPRRLDELEKFIHGDHGDLDALVTSFFVHYQFETIHPFSDGNGRVGRLLLTLMAAEGCAMRHPWLHLSPYFDKNRDRYIDLLYAVSARGAWRDWIEFCLKGVVEQARDILLRCDLLIRLKHKYRALAQADGEGSVRLGAIIDDLFKSPVLRPAALARSLDVTYPTAQKDIDRLTKLGILRELPDRYPKTYVAPLILRVSYDDVVHASLVD